MNLKNKHERLRISIQVFFRKGETPRPRISIQVTSTNSNLQNLLSLKKQLRHTTEQGWRNKQAQAKQLHKPHGSGMSSSRLLRRKRCPRWRTWMSLPPLRESAPVAAGLRCSLWLDGEPPLPPWWRRSACRWRAAACPGASGRGTLEASRPPSSSGRWVKREPFLPEV